MLTVERQFVDQRHGLIATELRVGRPRFSLPSDAADLQEFLRRSDEVRSVDQLIREAREDRVREMLRLGRERPELEASVPGNAYVVNTGTSAVGLTAATAKTIMYLLAGAANQGSIIEFAISFDGVTASAIPVLVEECLGTAASNSTPGTGSTSFTPLQRRGWPVQTSANTAAVVCTSEPTVLTPHKHWLITPNGGVLLLQYPMGRELTGLVTAATAGKMLAFRTTAPAIVNTRGYFEYEE